MQELSGRLAALRDPRCQSPLAKILEALRGDYRAEYLFVPGQCRERREQTRAPIARCDAEIARLCAAVGEGAEKRRACHAGKKKRHPLKAQVLLEQGTRRILAVGAGKGRRHDFHLFKQSRARVRPGVPIFCDTGYQGIQKLPANTRQPAKATKKRPLTPEQKRANRQINSERVVVEHAIRRLKVFRLLGERYRNRRRRFGLRLNLIAAPTNLE